MNKRIWLLLVLFSATLLIRGMHIYHLFSSPSSTIEWAAGASYTIEGNQLTVRSVRPKNPSGQPTLAAQGGLQKGDRILAIYNVRGAGKMIRSLFDYGEVARTIQFGEPWTLVIARDVGGGKWREQRLSVPPMLASDPDFDAWLLIIALGVALPLIRSPLPSSSDY